MKHFFGYLKLLLYLEPSKKKLQKKTNKHECKKDFKATMFFK